MMGTSFWNYNNKARYESITMSVLWNTGGIVHFCTVALLLPECELCDQGSSGMARGLESAEDMMASPGDLVRVDKYKITNPLAPSFSLDTSWVPRYGVLLNLDKDCARVWLVDEQRWDPNRFTVILKNDIYELPLYIYRIRHVDSLTELKDLNYAGRE
jgi:hypothetical protein